MGAVLLMMITLILLHQYGYQTYSETDNDDDVKKITLFLLKCHS